MQFFSSFTSNMSSSSGSSKKESKISKSVPLSSPRIKSSHFKHSPRDSGVSRKLKPNESAVDLLEIKDASHTALQIKENEDLETTDHPSPLSSKKGKIDSLAEEPNFENKSEQNLNQNDAANQPNLDVSSIPSNANILSPKSRNQADENVSEETDDDSRSSKMHSFSPKRASPIFESSSDLKTCISPEKSLPTPRLLSTDQSVVTLATECKTSIYPKVFDSGNQKILDAVRSITFNSPLKLRLSASHVDSDISGESGSDDDDSVPKMKAESSLPNMTLDSDDNMVEKEVYNIQENDLKPDLTKRKIFGMSNFKSDSSILEIACEGGIDTNDIDEEMNFEANLTPKPSPGEKLIDFTGDVIENSDNSETKSPEWSDITSPAKSDTKSPAKSDARSPAKLETKSPAESESETEVSSTSLLRNALVDDSDLECFSVDSACLSVRAITEKALSPITVTFETPGLNVDEPPLEESEVVFSQKLSPVSDMACQKELSCDSLHRHSPILKNELSVKFAKADMSPSLNLRLGSPTVCLSSMSKIMTEKYLDFSDIKTENAVENCEKLPCIRKDHRDSCNADKFSSPWVSRLRKPKISLVRSNDDLDNLAMKSSAEDHESLNFEEPQKCEKLLTDNSIIPPPMKQCSMIGAKTSPTKIDSILDEPLKQLRLKTPSPNSSDTPQTSSKTPPPCHHLCDTETDAANNANKSESSTLKTPVPISICEEEPLPSVSRRTSARKILSKNKGKYATVLSKAKGLEVDAKESKCAATATKGKQIESIAETDANSSETGYRLRPRRSILQPAKFHI